MVPGSNGNVAQLAASAGISASEASGMSINEIFVAKINREGGAATCSRWSRAAT